jgi:hypothetical protein
MLRDSQIRLNCPIKTSSSCQTIFQMPRDSQIRLNCPLKTSSSCQTIFQMPRDSQIRLNCPLKTSSSCQTIFQMLQVKYDYIALSRPPPLVRPYFRCSESNTTKLPPQDPLLLSDHISDAPRQIRLNFPLKTSSCQTIFQMPRDS